MDKFPLILTFLSEKVQLSGWNYSPFWDDDIDIEASFSKSFQTLLDISGLSSICCVTSSNKTYQCIFRGSISNSAILNFAALVSRVQLLLKVHILPLTPLWEGFCQPGKKEEVNKKLFPFVKMVGKKQQGLLR